MTGFVYKSYSFVNKDPIIDEVRTIVQASGLSYLEIEAASGVTSKTMHNWFEGETRKPQAATLNAVARALGYKLGFVPYEIVKDRQKPSATPPGPSTRHVVQIAKIRKVQ